MMNVARGIDAIGQAALAPGAATHFSARLRALGAEMGAPVLDVGCGFASRLADAGIAAIGLDIDARRAAAQRGPALAGDARWLPFADASFAAAFSFGLLHHLDDADARRAIAQMQRVVRGDGSIVIFDGIRPTHPWRCPLAAAIRGLDRGHHMRSELELIGLFDPAAGWRYERVTYAMTGLEGVWCMWHGCAASRHRMHAIARWGIDADRG